MISCSIDGLILKIPNTCKIENEKFISSLVITKRENKRYISSEELSILPGKQNLKMIKPLYPTTKITATYN